MTNKIQLAPIVIFAYDRPKKLQNLLNSLEFNPELNSSKIIFYIDKYKTSKEKTNNNKVISIVESWSANYDCEVHTSPVNFGLKNNILNGINKTFENYEKAIFLEDDLEVSINFLNFMNKSLEKYSRNKIVKHISGYNFPHFEDDSKSSYFTPYMSCWGWGTWRDRWVENKNFSINNISNKSKFTRLKFSVFGYEKDFESQLIRNDNKEINTWAIYWFQHIILNKGLCLNPTHSLVTNNGAEGIHGINSEIYNTELNKNKITIYPDIYKVKLKNIIKTINFYRYKKRLKRLTTT